MPIYEYRCNQCGNVFEQLVLSCNEIETYCCPACGDNDTCKLMSSFCCGSSDSPQKVSGGMSSSCSSPSGGFS